MTDATKLQPLPEASARALSDQIEQRILTWRQRIMNKSGDRLALDDFMGKDSIDDLVDFVCDEWVIDAAIAAARAPLLAEVEALRKRAEDAERAIAWQPIETAPKDRTEILAWREDCGQFIASYTSADSFPLTQDELDRAEEEWLFSENWFTQWPQALRLEGSEVPTHWKPLGPGPIDAAIKGAAA